MVKAKILLNTYAERLLDFLVEHNVDSLESIESLLGAEFDLGISPLEKIQIDTGNTFSGIPSYRITYIVQGWGVPIEIIFRPALGYLHIVVKTRAELEGYTLVAEDSLGNRIQSKVFSILDFEVLEREIEGLRDY